MVPSIYVSNIGKKFEDTHEKVLIHRVNIYHRTVSYNDLEAVVTQLVQTKEERTGYGKSPVNLRKKQ